MHSRIINGVGGRQSPHNHIQRAGACHGLAPGNPIGAKLKVLRYIQETICVSERD